MKIFYSFILSTNGLVMCYGLSDLLANNKKYIYLLKKMFANDVKIAAHITFFCSFIFTVILLSLLLFSHSKIIIRKE